MNKEMFNWEFKHSPYIPYDPSVNALYTGYITHPALGGVQPFSYTGWRDENLAQHESCYIHAGLNPAATTWFKGSDAMRFLNENLANGFKTFAVGKSRHGVMCNKDGLLMDDGVLLRTGEDEFVAYWMAPYLEYKLRTGGYDVEVEDRTGDVFLYQLGGPTSLQIVEAATGENFHDLAFMAHRTSKIAGKDIRVLRIGMAGSLAYEIHGELEDAIPVYNALLEAGKEYGIKKLGRHVYWNTHTEGGFPQACIHFSYAWETDPEFMQWLKDTNNVYACIAVSAHELVGSIGDNYADRYFNPYELGWGNSVKFNHDFVGKEALEKIASEPHREMVTLEWNIDDVMDVYRSEFEDGEPYAIMEGPEDYYAEDCFKYRIDAVLDGDKTIGVSSGCIISWYYRKMISLCVIDPAYNELGKEVEILWGDAGERQKKIRAKVSRFPYLDEGRNDSIDVSQIPSGVK